MLLLISPWEENLFTFTADFFVVFTLSFAMINHVFSKNTKSTSLYTKLDFLVTRFCMSLCIFIFSNIITSLIKTLKLQILKIILNVPMDVSELDFLISFTLLWAIVFILHPSFDTDFAEYRQKAFKFDKEEFPPHSLIMISNHCILLVP